MSIDEATADKPPTSGRTHWRSHVLSSIIALAAAIYLSLFWVQIQPWMPGWLAWLSSRFRTHAVTRLVAVTGEVTGWTPTGRWVWGLVSVVMALALPWLLMAVFRRGRPGDIGLRWPNRVGWRLVAAGYLGTLPFLALMASSPDARAYYQRELSGWSFASLFSPYLAVLVAEHFLFNGVLLALLRPGRRWPVVPPPAASQGGRLLRVLRWVGLAQPTNDARGLQRVTRWIGLPDACLWAMLLQTALFGLVHVGKAPAEVAMSFPGGLALAYVAYRCNSWLVPMILHAATGLTVLALIWLWPS